MSKLKHLVACVLGSVIAGAAPGAMAQWAEQGPGPTLQGQTEGLPGNPVAGGVIAIAVDLAHPGTIYLATVNGGIWKSTNANTASPTWAPLTDLKLPALSMNSIAISPLSSSTIFAGTGSTSSDAFEGSPGFGVLRSTDGGANWSILAGATFAGRRINSIVPLARTSGGLAGQVVLAATLFDGGGVYRSANGGNSFARVSGTSGLPDAGASSLVDDRSSSGNSGTRVYAAFPASYGAGAAAGVYRSDDAGQTWTPVNTGLTGLGSSLRILLSVGRTTGVVYALVIDDAGVASGVFRSANGGATWTALGVPSPSINPGQQGIIHAAIEADPVNPNVVYIAGDRQDFPFPNVNGCSNFSANTFRGDASLASPWQNVVCNGAQGTSPHADARDMAFDSQGNLLQANDGGFYRLENPDAASRRWVSLNNKLRPTEMHSAAFDAVTRTALGGTQDTGTPMQNAPGSRFWTDFLQGDGGVVEVDDTSAGGAYSTRYTSFQFFGFFNRSTWSPSNTLVGGPIELPLLIVGGPGTGQSLFTFDPAIQFYNPYVLNRIDKRRMLIGTNNIYESRDQGDTLFNLYSAGKPVTSLSYGARLGGVAAPDAFYVGTAGAGQPYILHRSNSAKAIQTLVSYPGGGVRDLVMDPQDLRRVYVVDEQNRVWASCDEGLTWRDLSRNLPTLLGEVRTVEVFRATHASATVLIVGGLGGVFQLRDPASAGTTWSRLGSNLPHGLVLDLRYNERADVLIAGILGRGAWTLKHSLAGGAAAVWANASDGGAALDATGALAAPMALPATLPKAAPRARTGATPGAAANR
jgi:hypothetical protein